MDKAHKQTDKILEGLEYALKKMYSDRFKELKKEVKEIYAEMDLSKAKTPIERYVLAQKYKRLKKLEENFAVGLNETNKQAVKETNKQLFKVYKKNYAHGLDNLAVLLAITIPNKYEKPETKAEIEKGQPPYNQIAVDNMKDMHDLRKSVNKQVIDGIMQGETVEDLVDRLKDVVEMKLSDITRIARTQTTRLENKGRFDAYKAGAEMGYDLVKQWVAVGDDKTRDAHNHANGQVVDYDKPFIVDGEELMYPGDPNGSAGNVINCRCTMVAGLKN